MIEEPLQNIVTVIEGGEMGLSEVKEHLSTVYEELILVSDSFGKVSLLINALDKEFDDVQARVYWSKGIRNLPEGLSMHKVASVVLEEDLETALALTSEQPWFECFLNVKDARIWLLKEW